MNSARRLRMAGSNGGTHVSVRVCRALLPGCFAVLAKKKAPPPLLAIIDGRDKPFRTELKDRDYAAVRALARSIASAAATSAKVPIVGLR